jgi:SAM-dependent methyltransferase
MAAHKRGRRNIRRLTRRKIPLPIVGAARPDESLASAQNTELDFSSASGEDPNQVASAASSADLAAAADGGIASSLAELRLPEHSGAGASQPPAADPGASSQDEPAKPAADSGEATAADRAPTEPTEDEPTTNPHIRVSESLALPKRDATGFDTSAESDRPEAAKPPPAAGASSLPPPAPSAGKPATGATAENGAALGNGATASPAASADGVVASDEAESEPVTGQHRKLSAPPPGMPVARKSDSDAPTRPRIELSSDMALAAGRVTSLELSPIRSEQPPAPRRGSKVPPPGGEPRVVSSLTGRRSAFPPSSEEEDAAARPAVLVTRSKIISDRPSRLGESESRKALKRDAAEPVKRTAAETDKRENADVAKQEESVEPHVSIAPPSDADEIAAGPDIPEPETAEIKQPHAELKALVSQRPSRRPGAAEGDEFETLDIEDGEVESQSMRAEGEIDADFDEAEPTKAPPPPPQQKRAGAPPAPAAPAPPKAAPPPPPRVPGPVPAAAASPPVATSLPAPTSAGNPAAPAAAASNGAVISPASFGTGAAAAPPAKRGNRPQPRRRQWWETLFSDDYLRTVVRPSVAQIARQVDFMQASLGVTKGTAVLDVGCGLGQHALEFARRGCLVVALDLALPMITRAAEDAQQEGLRINFLHKDIRDIGFEGTFDAVVCVGTTFGFFDDEQNREVLGRLANALKPGGRLLLEVVNRDHVLASQPNLQWFEGDGCVVMEESDFNYYSSRLTVKRTMMREDGRQTESEYSIRLYALHELGQMMQAVGFRVKEVSGGQATRGVFFGAQSSRIILLAERRTPNPARGNGHSTSDAPASSES